MAALHLAHPFERASAQFARTLEQPFVFDHLERRERCRAADRALLVRVVAERSIGGDVEIAARDQRRHPLVSDVRGIGLLLGIELARAGAPAKREAEQVMYHCLAHGLSFKVGQGNVLTLSPPLVISDGDFERAMAILDTALTAVESGTA